VTVHGFIQAGANISLSDRVNIESGSIVADVGYGKLEELLILSRMVGATGTVYGFEPDETLTLETSKQLPQPSNIRLSVGDACKLPLPDGTLDFCILKGVLHEVKNVSAALAEAGRACKPDGKVVMVDFAMFPTRWLRWSNLKWRMHHGILTASALDQHPGFTREELSSSLRGTGLRLEIYLDNVAPGKFGRHRIPLFLAIASRETT
jgi:ubiquinone/menaquinone biosynthesis C-methylase UbiE